MRIDARGLSCPQPVILAKKAVESGEKNLEILVDDMAPKENVSRFLNNVSYNVTIKDYDDGYMIVANR